MGVRVATSGLRLTPSLGRSICLPGPVLPPGAPGPAVPSDRSVGIRRLSSTAVVLSGAWHLAQSLRLQRAHPRFEI
jgi:hypothetical protein